MEASHATTRHARRAFAFGHQPTEDADRLVTAEPARPPPPAVRDAAQGIHVCMPIVRAMVRHYARLGVDRDDLAQEGAMGVLDALERYDPSFGTRFTTYARWWIRHRMQKLVRSSRSIVTPPDTRAVRLARRRLLSTGASRRDGHESCAEIAEALGVDVQDVQIARDNLRHRDVALQPTSADDERALATPSSPDPGPEEHTSRSELRRLAQRLVRQAVAELDERERLIVAERTLSEVPTSLRELGERLAISGERVRQLERRAFQKMRGGLERAGAAPYAMECAAAFR